jgi:hypothetical protein
MKKLLFYFIVVFQIGCVLPKKVLPEDLSKTINKLPLFIEEVTVIDKRKGLKSMNWDVKTLTLKNQTYEGNPDLSSEHINAISQMFKNASTPDATPAKVTFYLETGDCIMKHHFKEQSSFTKVKGDVSIDISSRGSKFNGFAELQYTYNHPSVTKDHILQMYVINLKNVTHNIIQLIKKELEKDI